jgi:hypothetical protein
MPDTLGDLTALRYGNSFSLVSRVSWSLSRAHCSCGCRCCVPLPVNSALRLQGNVLTGTVPATVVALPSLLALRLEDNCLTIADPAALLASLVHPSPGPTGYVNAASTTGLRPRARHQ